MTNEMLIEIGTEEIPAAFMPGILASFRELMEQELANSRIACGDIQTCGTPRRIVLMARDVAALQKDLVSKKIGPAKRVAFDADGNPTKAAIGFARGQGIDVDGLGTVATEKGEYVCAEIKEQGRETAALLPEMLPAVIGRLSFPKSMRWGDLDLRFARPIHWIVALFGGSVVPFTLGTVPSGAVTYGHRFMSPGPVEVSGIDTYLREMKNAHVAISPDERRADILDCIRDLAESAGGVPDEDQALLDEVSWLVEQPHPVLCRFSEAFLALPREVLLTTMKKHQRYFPVLDGGGTPLPCFIAVNNTKPENSSVVVSGHERVLRARLSDAQFFYTEDRKKPLDIMTDNLKTVVFQAKLGTSYEKVIRFQSLALYLADAFVSSALMPGVERASYLCKSDLVSEMVGEFPELQGIMGREYARIGGEDTGVAEAIFEHYLPRFAGDTLPAGDVGAIISIADKLDTITGCFGIGLVPTGTADPYALRRQCLGIINIIQDKKYVMSLGSAVKKSCALLKNKLTRPERETCEDVLSFFSGRLENLLVSQGFRHDVISAVLSLGVDDILDGIHRVEALHRMKQDRDFEALAVSFKRVVNILSDTLPENVDPSRFARDEERGLHEKHLEISDSVKEDMSQRRYVEALKLISTIRPAVDSFFDNVLVMDEDERVRQNRLALLHEVSALFTDFADFSKISSE